MKHLLFFGLLTSFSTISFAGPVTAFHCDFEDNKLALEVTETDALRLTEEGKIERNFNYKVGFITIRSFLLNGERYELKGRYHNEVEISPGVTTGSSSSFVEKENSDGQRLSVEFNKKAKRRMTKLKKSIEINLTIQDKEGNKEEITEISCEPNS